MFIFRLYPSWSGGWRAVGGGVNLHPSRRDRSGSSCLSSILHSPQLFSLVPLSSTLLLNSFFQSLLLRLSFSPPSLLVVCLPGGRSSTFLLKLSPSISEAAFLLQLVLPILYAASWEMMFCLLYTQSLPGIILPQPPSSNYQFWKSYLDIIH